MCIRTRIHVYIHMCVCTCVCICIYVCACVRVYKFRIRVSKDILAWQFSDSFRSWKNDRCSRKKKKICIDVYISRRFDRYAGKEHVHRRNENVSKTEEGCLCSSCYTSERKKKTRRRNFLFFFVLFLLFFFFFFYYYYYYYYCLNLYFYATLVERENGFRSFRFLITRESLESREMKITYNYRWDRRPPLSSTIKRVRNGACLETVCACSNVHNITVILRYFFERGKGKKKN